jgi:hypothetical protein
MSILDRPELKDLAPETEREGLLYAKAYFEAIEATLRAVELGGPPAVLKLHEKMQADIEAKLKKKNDIG